MKRMKRMILSTFASLLFLLLIEGLVPNKTHALENSTASQLRSQGFDVIAPLPNGCVLKMQVTTKDPKADLNNARMQGLQAEAQKNALAAATAKTALKQVRHYFNVFLDYQAQEAIIDQRTKELKKSSAEKEELRVQNAWLGRENAALAAGLVTKYKQLSAKDQLLFAAINQNKDKDNYIIILSILGIAFIVLFLVFAVKWGNLRDEKLKAIKESSREPEEPPDEPNGDPVKPIANPDGQDND